jgi:hypothetical protein
MTPRQLRGLAELHREVEGGDPTPGGQAQVARRPAASTQGGAGWLLAVSNSLERNRPAARVNTPDG